MSELRASRLSAAVAPEGQAPAPEGSVDAAVLRRLVDAVAARFGGSFEHDRASMHWRPDDFDELLAAHAAAEQALHPTAIQET